jgi:diaminopimelate decarboxylase
MNIDVIRSAVMFPALSKGDHVVISRIGAYNMTQWLQFITYRPRVVLVTREGRAEVIREQETGETLNMLDVVPQHLKGNKSKKE